MRRTRGTTLIEIIIYTAVIVTVLTVAIHFTIDTYKSRAKVAAMLEAEHNARFAMITMGKQIRGAKQVNSPSQQSSDSKVILVTRDPQFTPTKFEVENGVLKISVGGGGGLIPVTSDAVRTQVWFTNVGSGGNRDAIQVQLTVSAGAPGASGEYRATSTLYDTFDVLD